MSSPLQSTSRPTESAYRDTHPRSDHDLVQEAASWLDREFPDRAIPPLLIVIGLAEGHLLDVLTERAPGTRVLALEPDRGMSQAFLARAGVAAWQRTGRLGYRTAPGYRGADEAWRLFPPSGDGFALLTHPRLSQSPHVVEAARAVKKIVFGVKANAEARRRFAPRYLRNVIRNVPAIARGRDVGVLAGRFERVPAVITAAGPSLDLVLEDLRDVTSHALLIATDTTLRPLLGAGIRPHLAVGADPGQANARHFHDLPECPTTWLVAESALDAPAAAAFEDRTLWFRLSNHQPWPWLRERGLDVAQMDMWGSVLTAAFQLACLAGCDPIVIVGADLAFTRNRPYCRGTTYEFDWAYWAGTGRTLEETWHTQMARGELTQIADLRGQPTVSTGSMLAFRDWMLARASRSGRRVVNATGGGTLHGEGIELSTLRESLTKRRPVPSIDQVVAGSRSRDASRAIRRELAAVASMLATGNVAAAPLRDWATFSGPDFDADALGRALQEVEQMFVDRGGASRAAVSTRDSLAYLPESTARLVSVLRSTPLPASPILAAVVRLVEALPMLQQIGDACRALPDLRPSEYLASAEPVPVAVSYEWPERLRWRIQRFEAALGAGASDARADLSFRRRLAPSAMTHPPGHARAATVRLAREWASCAATWTPEASAVSWRDALAMLEGAESSAATAPAEAVANVEMRIVARSGSRESSAAIPLWSGDGTVYSGIELSTGAAPTDLKVSITFEQIQAAATGRTAA